MILACSRHAVKLGFFAARGKTLEDTILLPGAYQPTPFSSPDNTYTGKLSVVNDQPVQLSVQSRAPNLPWYIQVLVEYQAVSTAPDIEPLCLTVDAIARVAAIGNAMHVPTGMPALAQDIVGELARQFLPWIQRPTANMDAPPPRAATITSTAAVDHDPLPLPVEPHGVYLSRRHALQVPSLLSSEEIERRTAEAYREIERERTPRQVLPSSCRAHLGTPSCCRGRAVREHDTARQPICNRAFDHVQRQAPLGRSAHALGRATRVHGRGVRCSERAQRTRNILNAQPSTLKRFSARPSTIS